MIAQGSHTLPDGSPPVSAMKESVSKAYIGMIAAACGLTLGTWDKDYDAVDVTLSSGVDYTACGGGFAPRIDVQLKCTGQEAAQTDSHVAWSLSTRTVDKFTKMNRGTPALLCVLVTSADYWDWLHLDEAGLLAKSHMYWLWGHQFPAAKLDQATQVVHVPKANVLTPSSMLELVEEASKWQPQIS